MTTTPFETRNLSPAKLALLRQRLTGQGGLDATGIPARPRDERVPLSPVQHALWVVDQFLADNSLYSMSRGLWSRGPLDVAALQAALDEVTRRHSVLRTVYPGGTEPVPTTVDGPADLLLVDVPGRDRAVELAGEELRRPFDLAAGPVFRCTLFRVTDEEHLVLLNTHHIAADGLSYEILGQELAELYSAAVLGTPSALPAPGIQYADYAHWQAGRVTGEFLERRLDYWRGALGGVRSVLRLPTDRPYPDRRSYRADRVIRMLDPESTSALRSLTRDHSATLFTALLSAFVVVLHRCSAQDTFAVGTLTSGRDRPEVDRLIGPFANTVAIPADVTGDPTFTELLARTQRAVLGAIDHQDVSFEQVVAAVQPARDPARNPLFQTLFQLVETATDQWAFAGLDVELAELHNDTGKVDLALFAADRGERIELEIEFSVDVFTAAGGERFADRLVATLESVLADPGSRLSCVDVLPAAERELVTTGWNDTAVPFPRTTVSELFEAAVRRSPSARAIIDTDGSIVTYAELNAMANRLAHLLTDSGVGRESVVGVCVEHSVGMFVALLGILKAGGAYVPLDPELPPERLGFMVQDTGARVVVTQDSVSHAVPAFDGLVVSLDRTPLADRPDTDLEPVSGPDNLVYVIYTSGSTGRPKGVMISHHSLINYLWWAIEGYGLHSGVSGAPMMGSIAFDLSVPNFFLPLIGGKDVTLLPTDRPLEALADLVRGRGDFSLLKVTPGHLDVLRGALGDGQRVESVRTFVVGADEVRPETVTAWRRIAPHARIIDEYGPTETVVGCSTYVVDETFDPAVPVPIGRPIANMTMYVLDDDLAPLPVGVVGELFIGGVGVARGYLNRRGLTAEKFVPDPFAPGPGVRMYRTGDLARFRADGNLEFLGRIDHQVKIRGYRVELGEIEARLLMHPAISEAVVVARQESSGQKRLAGYVVSAADVEPGELRGFLATTLPEYMVPSIVTVLTEMPLTAAGKVDRTALPEPVSAAVSYQAPATPVQRSLAESWSAVLGRDEVGLHDDFFDLGGDSILAIQIVARARQTGLTVTVRQVFQHRTVAALAEAVSAGPALVVHADQDTVTGPVEPTQIMRWFARRSVDHDHYNQSVLLECRPGVTPEILDRAMTALIAHHDALRLRVSAGSARIVPPDGRSVLHIAPDFDINTRLSLADGPTVAAALLHDDRLQIVVHHIAVDAVSWNILLADLETVCAQLEAGRPVNLPAKSTSFQRWAERLAESPGVTVNPESGRLPVDRSDGRNTEESARGVDITLPVELTDSLVHRVPAAYRTEINDVLLTALAATIAEWTGNDSAFVEIEGHGREHRDGDVDVSRTVGWFTKLLPIDLHVTGSDWGDRLKSVKEQLRAVPGDGTDVQSAWPAELCFNYLGRVDLQRGGQRRFTEVPDVLGARRDPRGERSYLLEVTAGIEAGTLQVNWEYSADRHDENTVRLLAERYLTNLTALIEHCLTHTGATPSDFPLAGLDQTGLDGLLAEVGDVVEDVYPFSPLQTGMLFHSTYDQDSRNYLEQLGFVIRGGLDVAAFERAWQRVVDRHAVLRTRFCWEGLPAPMQVVLRDRRIRMERPTCSLADHLIADRERGIDLAADPSRFAVLATGPDEHSFVWTFHHVMLDRWSVSAVLDEVFAYYDGRTIEYEPPRYRDHIAWSAAQDRTADAAFWHRELAGLTEPTPLPVRVDLDLSRVRTRFPADLTEQVRELAHRARCTVNTVLHMAWGLLLSRYSGTDDVLFGTTVAGRGAAVHGVEHMVGLLINTIPTRVTLDQDASVLDHLAAHHAKLLELGDHEHSALVDIHRCTDIPAGTPLFDTRFVYENFGDGQASGLDVESIEDIPERTSYPVVIEIHHGAGIDVAARSTVDAMPLLEHFVHLVGQMAARPEGRLHEIELLTPAQRELMLREWNDTDVPIPDHTLAELFENQVRTAPDSIALVDPYGQTTTYGELNTRANRLANHLRSLGVACETPVGVSLERSVDLMVAILAVAKAGGAYVPLDPDHAADRIAHMIEDSGIDIVVATTGPASYRGILVDPGAGSVTDDPTPLGGPGNLAYVMYTPGSTGRPKGVLVEQRSVVRSVRAHSCADVTARAVRLQLTPMSSDVFAVEAWSSLLGGGRLVIGPPEWPTLTQLRRLITDHGVTQMWLTGSVFNLIVDEDPTVLSGIERLVIGGEALSVRHVRAARSALPGMAVTNGYGSTEVAAFAACHPVVDVRDDALTVPVGRPIANTETYVLDAELRPVPAGVVGELCIGGVGVARGYSNQPGLTADTFVPNPFGSGRLCRTGDLARWTADGLLEHLGRVDHQMTVRGHRIELGGIEARLRTHPQVGDAVVRVRDSRLVGYVTPAGTGLPTVAEIHEFLSRDLSEHMIPTVWVPLDWFPLTTLGRIDREALPDPVAVEAGDGDGYAPPADAVESALADMWSQVLLVDRVGVRDDFFQLGGDSILAIQIVTRARQAGLAVTLRQMFEQRTIARIAAVVRSTTVPAVRAEQGLVLGPVELTPIMHRFAEAHRSCEHHHHSVVLTCGPAVAPEVLDRALTAVIEHHDALRLRLVGGSASIVAPDGRSVLMATDSDAVAQGWRRGVSVATGSPVRATLVGSRLQIVIHHLVVDTESWNTILTDLATACAQVEAGEPVRLPAKTTSFQQWAQRLADLARSAGFETAAPDGVDTRGPYVELPVDHRTGPNDEGHARGVRTTLPAALTEALVHEVPLVHRTEINDILVTALATTLTEWAGGALVALEGRGREALVDDVDLSRTVGCFTTVLPLLLAPAEGDWGARLNAVKEQLHSIPNHGGVDRSTARYLRGDRDMASAQISFTYSDRPAGPRGAGGRFTELAEHRAADRVDDCVRPCLIDVHAVLADDRLQLTWTYSTERHREATIRALAEKYVARLTELIEYCAVTDGGATPSDFPLVGLTQEQVDHLLHDLRGRQIGPRQIENVHPLSPLQTGILFHTLGTADSTDHVVQTGYVIRGDVDASAFVAAVQHTVDRHAGLRSVVAWDGLPAPVRVTLRRRDADVRRPTGPIEDVIREDRARPFDLGGATPCRFTLVATAPDEHCFLWTYHRTLLDSSSASAVVDEIFAGYEELRHGRAPQLPPAAGLGVTVRQALPVGTTDVTGLGQAPLPPVLRRFLARRIDHDRHNQSMVLTWHQAPDPALLEQALCAVVANHEGLRLRVGDDRLQVEGGGVALRVVTDLEAAAGEINAEMRLAGPLLHAALSGRRLLLVAHQVATDLLSWSIVVDDIATAYSMVEAGAQPALAPERTTYREWATRLAEYARSDQMLDDSAFWLAHRPASRALPLDRPDGRNTEASRAVVETRLPAALAETLQRRAPRVVGSRLEEVLLWAVARAVTHWTGGTDTVVDLESDGREPMFDDVDLARTVGRCTSVYPVHLHVSGEDPTRGLVAVREQLRAVPHRGVGYGPARYLRADTAATLAARPPAEVAFTYRDAGDHLASPLFDASFDAPGETRAAESAREHVIEVDAAVAGGEIVLEWTYSTELHHRETIERIARRCLAELADLTEFAAAVRDSVRRPVERVVRHTPALIVPMVRHHVRGVSVALIEGGEVTDAWGEGVTGGELSEEVGPHTVFQACSLSKHVTALGVMRLVQDGTLELDEDVSRYLRSWQLPAGPGRITVRHLLSHTAGLVSVGYHEASLAGGVPTLAPMLALIGRERAPGESFEYSGVNFAVLQQVVEDTVGRPLAAELRSLVLNPLGMGDSGFEQDFPARHADVAHGHTADGSPSAGDRPVVPDVGSSGLWSTAGDLAKVEREILAAITGGRPVFLDHDLATEMITPKTGDYALGTATGRGGGAHWFGHPGDRQAYQGFTAVDLNTGAGLAMLANIGGDVPFLGNVVNELDLGIHYKIR